MEEAVNEKRMCFKLWKAGAVGLHTTTQPTRHPNVQFTRPGVRREAEKVALQKIYPRFADVYRLAKQMQHDNQDVI